MTTYHYQCKYCYCTTRMWTEEDDREEFFGGAVEDCGCQSMERNDEDDY